MINDHVSQALIAPSLIRLTPNIVVARFELLKAASARGAVEALLACGRLRPGDSVIDSSSGVYAYALGLACHHFGLRCHIVGSNAIDPTLRAILEGIGVRLTLVPPKASIKLNQEERVNRLTQILAENPGMYWMRQYHDPIHYIGYRAIAEMISGHLDTSSLTVVGGVGSGASTGGIVSRLREDDASVTLVGVQPFGSVSFGPAGEDDGQAAVAGIGTSILFQNVHHNLYDRVHWISFELAAAATRVLLTRHALFAGMSSGASYLAATWEAQRTSGHVLFIAADTGHRYLESVYRAEAIVADLNAVRPMVTDRSSEAQPPWAVQEWNRKVMIDG